MENITNDLVTNYINSYYKPISKELSELRLLGEAEMVPIILKETEYFLNTVLSLSKPKRILEIGTAIGYSSIYFSTISENSIVYSIEKNKKVIEIARENIDKYGLNNRIRLFNGDGEDMINEIKALNEEPFDMIFIDAAKSHYKRFFDSALPLCHENTMIISDNILQRSMTVSDQYDVHDKHRTNIRRMREYVDYICTDSRFSTNLFTIGDGIAVTTFNKNNE